MQEGSSPEGMRKNLGPGLHVGDACESLYLLKGNTPCGPVAHKVDEGNYCCLTVNNDRKPLPNLDHNTHRESSNDWEACARICPSENMLDKSGMYYLRVGHTDAGQAGKLRAQKESLLGTNATHDMLTKKDVHQSQFTRTKAYATG